MGINLSIFNSKKTPKAFLIALFLLIGIYILELFVLPVNFFTFRVWEALAVRQLKDILPGPFYSNMQLDMVEQGDMGHHTSYALKQRVHWETDPYGYRKRDEKVNKYDIVVVGDSFIAGSRLSQEDMFTEQLEKTLKETVYPFAPEKFNSFLNSSRFKDNPPEIVIMAEVERNLFKMPPAIEYRGNAKKKDDWVKLFFQRYPGLAVLTDRICKKNMFEFFKAHIPRVIDGLKSEFFKGNKKQDSLAKQEMAFTDSFDAVDDQTILRIVEAVKSYKDALSKRGIRFIFFPIPNKKTIYGEKVIGERKSDLLNRIIKQLKEEKLEVIDVEKAYRQSDQVLYYLYDTHWNAFGVKLAVDAAVKQIKSR